MISELVSPITSHPVTRTVIEEPDERVDEKIKTTKLALPVRAVHKLNTIRNRRSVICLEQEISPKNVQG